MFPKVFSESKNEIEKKGVADVSEQIEQVVLNLLGKNIILWEKFLNIINKINTYQGWSGIQLENRGHRPQIPRRLLSL